MSGNCDCQLDRLLQIGRKGLVLSWRTLRHSEHSKPCHDTWYIMGTIPMLQRSYNKFNWCVHTLQIFDTIRFSKALVDIVIFQLFKCTCAGQIAWWKMQCRFLVQCIASFLCFRMAKFVAREEWSWLQILWQGNLLTASLVPGGTRLVNCNK